MNDSGSFVPSQDGSSQGDLTPKMMAHTDGPESFTQGFTVKITEVRDWLKARGYAEPELLAIQLCAQLARENLLGTGH